MKPTRLTACFVMQTKWQHAFLTWKASNHCVVHIGVNTYGHSLQVTWSASWFCHFLIFHTQFWCAIIVSQSCAVGKSGIFWRATGQSNSANRMKNCSIGQGAVVWVRKPNFGSFWCVSRLFAKFDCPVARQNFPLLATAHDCETGFLRLGGFSLISHISKLMCYEL